MTVVLAAKFRLMDHPMIFLSNRSMKMVRYSHPCLVLTQVMSATNFMPALLAEKSLFSRFS